jgi:serine/threonine protein kinase
VLLKQEVGGRLKAQLTDFGISQVLDGKSNIISGMEISKLNGASIFYASPETIKRFRMNIRDVSPSIMLAGDIYCVGSVIYEMIITKSPWR